MNTRLIDCDGGEMMFTIFPAEGVRAKWEYITVTWDGRSWRAIERPRTTLVWSVGREIYNSSKSTQIKQAA